MARPIMFWAETNVAFVVFLLVIPAKNIETTVCCFLIEPDGWKHSARGLNPHSCCAFALNGNDSHIIASITKRAFKEHVMHVVIG